MVVQQSGNALRSDAAWAPLASQVVQKLHLKGLQFVAVILVLVIGHLVLVHRVLLSVEIRTLQAL